MYSMPVHLLYNFICKVTTTPENVLTSSRRLVATCIQSPGILANWSGGWIQDLNNSNRRVLMKAMKKIYSAKAYSIHPLH